MIQNIFLPSKIGNYYLFTQRIVGIDIGKKYINATIIEARGKTIFIKDSYTVSIENNAESAWTEQVVLALKKLMSLLPRYDKIRTSICSSLVIFKELKLPFIDREKIALVIKFEVEPLLPFTVQDAVIDFIITKTFPEEKSSQVLVACVQKQHIAEHISLFNQLQIEPDIITVDFFDLYSLYRAIPFYNQTHNSHILIDVGYNSTRIGYIQNEQLRFIRILPQGFAFLAKQLSQQLSLSLQDTYENIVRFGLISTDDSTKPMVTKEIFQQFFQSINFIISSFAEQTNQNPIEKIVLVGSIADVKGIEEVATHILTIPTHIFNIHLLNNINYVTVKNLPPIDNIFSTATAIPWNDLDNFNLRKEEFFIKNSLLLYKQIIVMSAIIALIFGSLITHYIIQTKKISTEVTYLRTEIVKHLKEQFPKIITSKIQDTIQKDAEKNEQDLEQAISLAQEAVEKEKETWFAFSYANQARYLQYLLELTNKIDKNNLNLDISKITITEGMIIMQAQVKDLEMLKILERELRTSPLFTFVEPQDNLIFTMHITLAPATEEL